MSWMFNPPPGWPVQPAGWVPPPGWTPDPTWPAPPAGWQFWIPVNPQTSPSGVPHPPPHQQFPHHPPPHQPLPQFQPHHPAAGWPVPGPTATGPTATGPWYGRWWAMVGLVVALIVGGLLGFAGTSAGLNRSLPAEQMPVTQTDSVPAPASPSLEGQR